MRTSLMPSSWNATTSCTSFRREASSGGGFDPRTARDAGAVMAARVAKVAANGAAHLANVEALQLHGGIGFTWEHDLHFWLKRGLALEAFCGASADHRRALAAHVFES